MHVVKICNMANENNEESNAKEMATLALDSNKQKEFEDRVKRISATVRRRLFYFAVKRMLSPVSLVLFPYNSLNCLLDEKIPCVPCVCSEIFDVF